VTTPYENLLEDFNAKTGGKESVYVISNDSGVGM
jgi:hypothetical protein